MPRIDKLSSVPSSCPLRQFSPSPFPSPTPYFIFLFRRNGPFPPPHSSGLLCLLFEKEEKGRRALPLETRFKKGAPRGVEFANFMFCAQLCMDEAHGRVVRHCRILVMVRHRRPGFHV